MNTKTKIMRVLFVVATVLLASYLIFQIVLLAEKQKENRKPFDGAALQKMIDEEKQCPEKLYGILLGLRYSLPEVYDTVSEVARVKNFSCSEYLEFFENMGSEGNQKK